MTDHTPLYTMRRLAPRVHCITNPVVMQDTANALLTAGGSAIMAQDVHEVAEITALCHATLLNTGVPDESKFEACRIAGQRANALKHPVVLDPVGVGASAFRRAHIAALLRDVQPTVIRCNQEEASVLLQLQANTSPTVSSGGVESNVTLDSSDLQALARHLAQQYHCVVYISGTEDIVSDGLRTQLLTGGDSRMKRITGSGCMLSALMALFLATSTDPYDTAVYVGRLWKRCATLTAQRLKVSGGGMGSYHQWLFDALDRLCRV